MKLFQKCKNARLREKKYSESIEKRFRSLSERMARELRKALDEGYIDAVGITERWIPVSLEESLTNITITEKYLKKMMQYSPKISVWEKIKYKLFWKWIWKIMDLFNKG